MGDQTMMKKEMKKESSNFAVEFVKENMKKKSFRKRWKVSFRESPGAGKWSTKYWGLKEVNKWNWGKTWKFRSTLWNV